MEEFKPGRYQEMRDYAESLGYRNTAQAISELGKEDFVRLFNNHKN